MKRRSLHASLLWLSTFWCAAVFLVFTVIFMISYSTSSLNSYKRVNSLEMATLLGRGVDQLAQENASSSWDRYVAVTDSVIELTDSHNDVLFEIGSPMFTDARIQAIMAAVPPQPTYKPWTQLNWSYPYQWHDSTGEHRVLAVTEGVTYINGSKGQLILISLTDPLRQEAMRILTLLVVIDLLVIALFAVGMWMLLWRGFRPLTMLMEGIRAVEWKHSARLKLSNLPPELGSLQQSVNQLLGRIDEGVQEQSRFIADASHELRTPLAIIAGHANLLRRWGNKNERVWEPAVRNIVSEVERLQKLVNQLLSMARMDNSVQSPQVVALSSVDILRLFNQLQDDTKVLRPDIRMRVKVHLTTASRAYIHADHLRQILVALLDNAMRYTPENGRIHLTANGDEDMVRFTVADSGEGIPSDVLPNVFDRFYRADSSRAMGRGSGLGLSICKQIVESYDGKIYAKSRPGRGTTIIMLLPMHILPDGDGEKTE